MAGSIGTRRVVRAKVYDKYVKVTADAESARRYESAEKTRFVPRNVVTARLSGKGQQTSWLITADYDFSGREMKRMNLNVHSVKSGDPPDQTPASASVFDAPPLMPDTNNRDDDGGDRQRGSLACNGLWVKETVLEERASLLGMLQGLLRSTRPFGSRSVTLQPYFGRGRPF